MADLFSVYTFSFLLLIVVQAVHVESRAMQTNKTTGPVAVTAKTETRPKMIPPKPKNMDGPLRVALKNDDRCKEDIADFCAKEAKSGRNYDVLVCLQNLIKEDDLSEECHAAVWDYKGKVVNDENFEQPAKMLCQEDLSKLEDCKAMQPGTGEIVPCLVENFDRLTNARCKHVVSKLAQILFSDYKLLKHFYRDCKNDVQKFSCGRVDVQEKEDIHTQGSTLECLEDNQANLTDVCRHRVMRAAELQSEDYHLNRVLYFACRDDRERLCANVQSGKGKVYSCLMKNKFHPKMSQECKEKLSKKQKVEQKDYKANFPFLDSCKAAIKKYQCQPAGDSTTQLAKVLLCLEAAMNEGNDIGGKCQAHMSELQQQLMEDYSVNPAVVAHCQKEIKRYCGKIQKGGRTLDCLMEKAMESEDAQNKVEKESAIEFSKQCYKAVNELLKETGAGGDFKVDATLRATCRLSAEQLCPDSKNDVSALSCLFENLQHKDMAIDCKEQLMHLQFFLARDFKLDKALYRVCKKDAERLCDSKDPDKETHPQGLVLACLYRHSFPNKYAEADKRVSKACAGEVMRTMHRRANDVKLLPEIQQACMTDIVTYCTNKAEPGDEIKCLQDNLEKLTENCRTVIAEFTEEESEDIDLDKSLIKHCTANAKEFCKDVMENNDAAGILPCLYKHKYERTMSPKCRAELEHRQLIELKDYRFSARFREACMGDVKASCPDSKTKADVIECLSNGVRNAVIDGTKHVISSDCRTELRVAKLRQAEDIKFDPKMYGACQKDVAVFCADVHKVGPAAVLECLRKKEDKLSDDCKKTILKREKAEVNDAELDVRLFRVCKTMIKKFCSDVPPKDVLGCLRKHRRDMDTDEKCRDLVFVRQKNKLKELDLDPDLAEACKKDLSKFCAKITNAGMAIPCLKKNIERLSEQCEEHIAELEEEAALDFRLNPSLAKECENDINKLCGDKEPGHGEVMECLKDHYSKIESKKCKTEVKEVMLEERTDVMADPVVHESCSTTITKHCGDIHHGHGNILRCLLGALAEKKIREKECRNVLRARQQMWSVAQVSGPESLSDLAASIGSSPHRNYFFIVFTCVLAVIFIGGLVSGRLSKRVARDAKNR